MADIAPRYVVLGDGLEVAHYVFDVMTDMVAALPSGLDGDAQARADHMNALYLRAVALIAQRVRSEVADDIAMGTVPADVKAFSDLHDYVDANEYGGLCAENFGPTRMAFDVQNVVHEWLAAGRLDFPDIDVDDPVSREAWAVFGNRAEANAPAPSADVQPADDPCGGGDSEYRHIEEAIAVPLHAAPDGAGGGWRLCLRHLVHGYESAHTVYDDPRFQVIRETCGCSGDGHDDWCNDDAAKLENASFPDATALLHMLADALGYTVAYPGGTTVRYYADRNDARRYYRVEGSGVAVWQPFARNWESVDCLPCERDLEPITRQQIASPAAKWALGLK
ncbi:hypothetical protein SAMN05421837_107315 [Amycolatopsis pretoriensis]|uniref:Uncharacterized protein n=2 Tax=Amycolatopsis pretoriensis TaxID=218821 RepID=A0A1H5R7A5_9PSEU|nr:hypothetical protein SAMN05421837_107315 [Amycolatopsis pretoriensis]